MHTHFTSFILISKRKMKEFGCHGIHTHFFFVCPQLKLDHCHIAIVRACLFWLVLPIARVLPVSVCVAGGCLERLLPNKALCCCVYLGMHIEWLPSSRLSISICCICMLAGSILLMDVDASVSTWDL